MKNHDENAVTEKQNFNATGGFDNSDEIDLVDLWLVLARHKILILLSILLVSGVGIGAAFMMKVNYTFSTSIDVGRVFTEEGSGKMALIEPLETIQAKLKESYLPLVLGQFAADNQFDKAGVKINVNIPKGSQLIVLQSRGTLDTQATHRDVHEAILLALQADHGELTGELQKRLDSSIAEASLMLDELEDPRLFAIKEKKIKEQIDQAKRNQASLAEQREMISIGIKDLEKLRGMLAGQAQKIRESIEKNLETRVQAAKETDNAVSAMTLLMMDNQIEQSRTRLNEIQERLELGLAGERRVLEKDLSDNQRASEAQKAEIEQLQLQQVKLNIDHENELTRQKQTIAQLEYNKSLVKNTRALALAVRSVNPVGTKKVLVVALSVVLGAMFGILLAFGAVFRQKVQAKALEAKGSGPA